MTFDPEMLTGKKFAGALIDELHVIAKNSKASKAIRQIRGGMVPFPRPSSRSSPRCRRMSRSA
jgi:phage terminase large subunit-like protein